MKIAILIIQIHFQWTIFLTLNIWQVAIDPVRGFSKVHFNYCQETLIVSHLLAFMRYD